LEQRVAELRNGHAFPAFHTYFDTVNASDETNMLI
jgi:hypothetical protein